MHRPEPDPAMNRRAFVGHACRIGSGALLAASSGGLLAACGQKQAKAVSISSALAAPGTTIPTAQLSWAMAPYPDETMAVIAMRQGWFSDVGIQIGPTATGAKFDLTESIAPLVSRQVDVGSGVFEVFASQLDTSNTVRSFVTFDTFEGFGFMAPPEAKDLKSVQEFQAEGQAFEQAVRSTMAQLKGKTVGTATDPASRLFYNICFDLGGVRPSDFDRKDLANPSIVSAALSSRLDIAAPSGGVEIVRLRSQGFKTLLDVRTLIKESGDARRLQLVTHGVYLTRSDYYDQHYETMLRAASVIYRVLDQLRADHAKAASYQLPFLNAYTGTKLTESQLAQIHKTVAVLRTFDEMPEFYEGTDANNIYIDAQAQIDQLHQDHVLKKPHKVGEIEGAHRVYRDLLRYKAESDRLFKAVGSQGADLVRRARAQYDARNYLDSYRFLAAQSQA
ncbi:MAG: hypothetical protein QOG11_1907 [Solirubrobacteraceae bacterium]|nr:hypothetical protein [Solirubrobacteraceae bacterium]